MIGVTYPAEDHEVTTKDSLYSIRDRAEIKTILYNPIKYEKAAGECNGDSTLNHPNAELITGIKQA